MIPAIKTEAFVLAGGKSSRMGKDKGMVLLKGKPMVSYILETLTESGIPVKIIANNPAYRIFGFPIFADVIAVKGPMGGLLTALENTEAELVLLVSCDMPFLNTAAVNRLLKMAAQDIIFVSTVEERVNPLFALYPVSLKQEIEKRIKEGRLKMTDFILENKHTLVPYLDRGMPYIFRNINDEEELKMTEKEWINLK